MILDPNSLGFDMENEEVRAKLPTLLHDCIKSLQSNVQDFSRVFVDVPSPNWVECLYGVEILQRVGMWDNLIASTGGPVMYTLLCDSLYSPHAGQLLKICLKDTELRKRFLHEYLLVEGALIERYSHIIFSDMAIWFDQYCFVFNHPDVVGRPVVLSLVVGLLDELCQNIVSFKRESALFLAKVYHCV
jgi:hypothetical protein